MDESAALEVTAVRAIETADTDRSLWSDGDREWASRTAAESVGDGAGGETFLARRAQLVLERLGAEHPSVPRAVRALHWRAWIGAAIVAGAFVLGGAVDRIGGAEHINLLAPPVYALLLWNLVVYVTLVVRLAWRGGGMGAGAGPLRALLARVAGGLGRGLRGQDGDIGALRAGLAALPTEWARLATPLYSVRAARVLHLAAAAMALGVIVGMYVRGLAFEYRATWESTFLGAEEVRALLAGALAPGSLLTGVAVPGVEGIEAIRSPASENAASWLHLLAGSVAAVVVVPRIALATGAVLLERRRSTHMPVTLAEPYYQRLLRGYGEAAVRLQVIPYSYAARPDALAGLETIVARVFGGAAALAVDPPLAWGDDDAVAAMTLAAGGDPVVVLFSLTATPEPETHGAFADAVVARAGAARRVVALVDESGFRARWPGDDERLAARRAAWADLLAVKPVVTVFVDLVKPELAQAEAALEAALAAPAAASPAVSARRTPARGRP